MSPATERLYHQLPAILRRRDADEGEPLRALAAVLQAEWDAIEADTETTWDNWFIETCEEWVVPYIGETLGVVGLRSLSSGEFSLRGYVANTLARRCRKGTAAATEQLARDVTGYPARAVELFAHTLTTPNVNHLRDAGDLPTFSGSVNVRRTTPVQPDQALDRLVALEAARQLERFGGPFDPFSHLADVRHIDRGVVRHNLPNLALFLWRVTSFEISRSTARPIVGEPGWFRFDPAGHDLALFNLPVGEDDITALAGPEHVPHPLTRIELYSADLSNIDPPVVVRSLAAGVETTFGLQICNLSDTAGVFPSPAVDPGVVAVDPELGRMLFNTADLPPQVAEPFEVLVDYSYGAPGRVGAGPFDRTDSLAAQLGDPAADTDVVVDVSTLLEAVDWQLGVSRTDGDVGTDNNLRETLEEAVVEWNAFINGLLPATRQQTVGLITITDSRSYEAPTTPVELPDGARLYIVGAQWMISEVGGVPTRRDGDIIANGCRPHVVGDLSVTGTQAAEAGRAGGLALNGVLLEGSVVVQPGDLETLDLAHCTVLSPNLGIGVSATPGSGNAGLRIRLHRSLAGPIEAPEPLAALEVTDSLLRAAGFAVDLAGGAVRIQSATVIGGIRCATLEASDSVLDEGQLAGPDSLDVAQPQEGCLRFSYVPFGTVTPRRHRCQPDLALEGITDPGERAKVVARLRPSYAGEGLGDPGIGLLSSSGPPELLTASSDASEPGVWHHLQHPARVANLRSALRQYLRFGLEAGVFVDR